MSLVKVLGSIPLGDLEIPKLRRSADGWDEVRELRVELTQDGIGLGAARSPAGISGTFFVVDTSCVGCKAGRPVMEIISRGLAGSKSYIAECTGYGDSVSGPFDSIPGAPAGVHQANVLMTRVGVTIRWLSSTKPDCSVSATAQTPPETFGLPSNPFTWLNDPAYNVPSGWVLDKRDGVQLAPGTTYYAVVDYYSYYRLQVPNPNPNA